MSDNTEEYKGHTKEYMWVFFALAVLTVLEIYIPEMDSLSKFGKGVALTASQAVIKAFAVGYWYMHLKDEKPWVKFIALIPLSAGAYAFLVLEGMYR